MNECEKSKKRKRDKENCARETKEKYDNTEKQKEECQNWMSLVIGNSRFHWALFSGNRIIKTWDIAHLGSEETEIPLPTFEDERMAREFEDIPVYAASVVPARLKALQTTLPNATVVNLADLLPPEVISIYPTMGVDRALALRGAGQRYNYPVLVVDCGSALTFTGADEAGNLHGGAIMPGIRLQRQILKDGTAALPLVETPQTETLPPRWAMSTQDAITSGILYGTLAAVADFWESWKAKFNGSSLVITGGDANLIHQGLQKTKLQSNSGCNAYICHQLSHYGIEYFRCSASDSIKTCDKEKR